MWMKCLLLLSREASIHLSVFVLNPTSQHLESQDKHQTSIPKCDQLRKQHIKCVELGHLELEGQIQENTFSLCGQYSYDKILECCKTSISSDVMSLGEDKLRK